MVLRAGVLACLLGVAPGGCRELGHTPVALSRESVPVQYAFGGAVRAAFRVDEARWGEIRGLFAGVDSAEAERGAIRPAVAAMEQTAGEQTETWRDHHRDHRSFGEHGQLDCVDESTNTTTYLDLFAQEGLLRFHTVRHPRWRFGFLFFDPHRTAVIRETATGTDYAVDSWPGDHGEEPIVQEFGAWSRKKPPGR